MGIHLGYIRRDMDEMKKNQDASHREIQSTLKELLDKSPTRKEFDEVKQNVDRHQELVESLRGDRKWVIGAVSVLIFLQGALVLLAKLYIENVVSHALSMYNISIR